MYINLLLKRITLSYATGLLQAYVTAPSVMHNKISLLLLTHFQMNIIV